MLRFTDRADRELLYSPTCEEMIVDIFRSYVRSYKQLPLNLYQIQWKSATRCVRASASCAAASS